MIHSTSWLQGLLCDLRILPGLTILRVIHTSVVLTTASSTNGESCPIKDFVNCCLASPPASAYHSWYFHHLAHCRAIIKSKVVEGEICFNHNDGLSLSGLLYTSVVHNLFTSRPNRSCALIMSCHGFATLMEEPNEVIPSVSSCAYHR